MIGERAGEGDVTWVTVHRIGLDPQWVRSRAFILRQWTAETEQRAEIRRIRPRSDQDSADRLLGTDTAFEWSGAATGVARTITVTVDQPLTIQANFR